MQELFRINRDLTEDDFKSLWENAVFVFDTNTLLDLYRLPESAKRDLLNILQDDKIKDRIWIPFQVILEYTQNTLTVIGEQKQKFAEVRKIVDASISELGKIYSNLTSDLQSLQLKKRHSVIDPDLFVNDKLMEQPLKILNEFLEKLEDLNSTQPDVNDRDLLKDQIVRIFEGKIGSGFSKDELESIFKDGELRYKDNVPPGYKDRIKEGFYVFQDKKFIRKFGDLVAWKEIIAKAKKDKDIFLVLVTGDRKEDWWQEKRGRKLGPRYELLNEIYFESPDLKLFHMYDTSGFMQYAKQYLNINIDDQSIKETKDILDFNSENIQISTFDNEIISLIDLIKWVAKGISIDVNFMTNIPEPVFLHLPNKLLHFVFAEILSNVYNHSSDKAVTVKYSEDKEYLIIEFVNAISKSQNTIQQNTPQLRGKGVEYIKTSLDKKYGHVDIVTSPDNFNFRLFINKKFTSLNSEAIFLRTVG